MSARPVVIPPTAGRNIDPESDLSATTFPDGTTLTPSSAALSVSGDTSACATLFAQLCLCRRAGLLARWDLTGGPDGTIASVPPTTLLGARVNTTGQSQGLLIQTDCRDANDFPQVVQATASGSITLLRQDPPTVIN
jgi:hypothetical protein